MTTTAIDLTALSERINYEHERAEGCALDALAHAVKAGALLLEAKDAMVHGAWLAWVGEHFAGSVRTAQRYMQLASAQANTSQTTHLTIEQALAAIQAPRVAHPPQPEGSLRESLAGVSREEAQSALAELGAPARDGAFPAPGMQARAWSDIEQDLRRVAEAMREARAAEGWSRCDALKIAARHAHQAGHLLGELADALG